MELIIDHKKVLKDFEAERAEKMESLCSDSIHTEKQFLDNLIFFNRREAIIVKALNYAKTLDFSKNHLKSSYLSHPLRLASYLLKFKPDIKANYIVIALLHNVPEVTEISIQTLAEIFGKEIATGIETLIVDRNVDFSSIQKSYYKAIFAKGTELVLIKLLDKIDNLFVLGLNPDDKVRKNYIAEIHEELLPFAFSYNIDLGKYLEALLNVTTQLGYLENLKAKLLLYQNKHL